MPKAIPQSARLEIRRALAQPQLLIKHFPTFGRAPETG